MITTYKELVQEVGNKLKASTTGYISAVFGKFYIVANDSGLYMKGLSGIPMSEYDGDPSDIEDELKVFGFIPFPAEDATTVDLGNIDKSMFTEVLIESVQMLGFVVLECKLEVDADMGKVSEDVYELNKSTKDSVWS